MGFLIRVVLNTLAILLAGAAIPGIEVESVTAALCAGLLLGLVNAFVRPLLLVLTLPITLVTLGLFLLVLNALCFWMVAAIIKGIHVEGFWAAFLGALVVSAVSWAGTAFVSDRGRIVVITRRPRPER
jgi:putative membrane protein